MARLGIDFGTTNTVVVCSDRGRYPVVPHVVETSIGHVIREVFPSIAVHDQETGTFLFGPAAERCLPRCGADRRFRVIRSLKRHLRNYAHGMRVGHDIQEGGFDAAALLKGFGEALRTSLTKAEFFEDGEPLEAVITWPANANGAQRYITRRLFRESGIQVIAAINEPTASAIEFADRLAKGNRMRARKLSTWVAVFDLGGGTFDASLVRINGAEFTVANAGGIEQLGGDDFDEILARLFAEKARINFDGLIPFHRELLLRHACQQKETIAVSLAEALNLNPEDLGLEGRPCTVSVSAYFAALRPLVDRAVEKLWSVVSTAYERGAGVDPALLDAVYLVGGSSRLPLVPRAVAERFPNARLVASDKPFTATAMGAAIHSAEAMTLHEVFSRNFGVIRLAENGTREFFAPVFNAGIRLPAPGEPPLEFQVEYSPCHSIGHLRFLECAGFDDAGRPADGVREWSEVLFPYDPLIPVGSKMTPDMIVRRDDLAGDRICETYHCDSDGVITVAVARCRDGQSCTYEVFRREA